MSEEDSILHPGQRAPSRAYSVPAERAHDRGVQAHGLHPHLRESRWGKCRRDLVALGRRRLVGRPGPARLVGHGDQATGAQQMVEVLKARVGLIPESRVGRSRRSGTRWPRRPARSRHWRSSPSRRRRVPTRTQTARSAQPRAGTARGCARETRALLIEHRNNLLTHLWKHSRSPTMANRQANRPSQCGRMPRWLKRHHDSATIGLPKVVSGGLRLTLRDLCVENVAARRLERYSDVRERGHLAGRM